MSARSPRSTSQLAITEASVAAHCRPGRRYQQWECASTYSCQGQQKGATPTARWSAVRFTGRQHNHRLHRPGPATCSPGDQQAKTAPRRRSARQHHRVMIIFISSQNPLLALCRLPCFPACSFKSKAFPGKAEHPRSLAPQLRGPPDDGQGLHHLSSRAVNSSLPWRDKARLGMVVGQHAAGGPKRSSAAQSAAINRRFPRHPRRNLAVPSSLPLVQRQHIEALHLLPHQQGLAEGKQVCFLSLFLPATSSCGTAGTGAASAP